MIPCYKVLCGEPRRKCVHTTRTELSLQNGCVLWGNRIVVPPPGRGKLLEQLHEGHPGVVKMKSIARSYFWWPRLDHEIETKVKTCTDCQMVKAVPAAAPLHPWQVPERPCSHLHIDYAGPVKGQMLLIIVDAYSKWLEVYSSGTSTSAVTIEKLRQAFAQHGLPDTIVSDN
ncbi:uncharacterized protein K02A2.6-like [Ylistrum balloti]|uniref:uncharacterized protein K02A2.6-like n=1 Tax=Ylistrum balloti TaxID=509963 RepID=UPI002905A22A|nr:uncharacterized protein K02A2.6-like [Ylistrum balloti]